jgi:hypothetical protein
VEVAVDASGTCACGHDSRVFTGRSAPGLSLSRRSERSAVANRSDLGCAIGEARAGPAQRPGPCALGRLHGCDPRPHCRTLGEVRVDCGVDHDGVGRSDGNTGSTDDAAGVRCQGRPRRSRRSARQPQWHPLYDADDRHQSDRRLGRSQGCGRADARSSAVSRCPCCRQRNRMSCGTEDRVERRDSYGLAGTTYLGPSRGWSPPFALSDTGDQIAGFGADGSLCVLPFMRTSQPTCLSSGFPGGAAGLPSRRKATSWPSGLQAALSTWSNLTRGQPRAQRRNTKVQSNRSRSTLAATACWRRRLVCRVGLGRFNRRVPDRPRFARASVRQERIDKHRFTDDFVSGEAGNCSTCPTGRNRGVSRSTTPRFFVRCSAPALSADGTVGAIGGYKHFVQLWDLKAGSASDLYEAQTAGFSGVTGSRLFAGRQVPGHWR